MVVQLAERKGFRQHDACLQMQSGMNLAFPRDYPSLLVAQLFKDRNTKRAPKQVPVVVCQGSIFHAGQNNREFQAGKLQQPAKLLIRQFQCLVEGRDQALRRKGP